MSETVEAFHEDFFNEVRTHADAAGRFMETAFLENYGEWLVNSGEFETFDVAPYRAARGMRVDAYGGDPSEAEGVLSLAVVDFNPDARLASLTRTDVEPAFKRLENFLRASLSVGFRDHGAARFDFSSGTPRVSENFGTLPEHLAVVERGSQLVRKVVGLQFQPLSVKPIRSPTCRRSEFVRLISVQSPTHRRQSVGVDGVRRRGNLDVRDPLDFLCLISMQLDGKRLELPRGRASSQEVKGSRVVCDFERVPVIGDVRVSRP